LFVDPPLGNVRFWLKAAISFVDLLAI